MTAEQIQIAIEAISEPEIQELCRWAAEEMEASDD